MAPGTRALAFASRWFDPAVVDRTFEPLIADWQRELEGTSGFTRWWIVASGWSALMFTVTVCLLTGGSVMPSATMLKGIMVLALSTLLLIAVQIALNASALRYDFPFEMRFWMALPMVLPLVIPLATLPMLMLMRASGRVTIRSAGLLVCTAALAAYVTAGWLAPLARGDVRAELYDQIDQREAARDASGAVSYPGTAVRQVRTTTAEQRAAARRTWQNSASYIEAQTERTRPRWGRAAILTAALAMAMGVLGWALGGLRPGGAPRAGAWWAFALITLLVLDGRFAYPGSGLSVYIGRAPYWLPLAVFATAALVVSIAARRRQEA